MLPFKLFFAYIVTAYYQIIPYIDKKVKRANVFFARLNLILALILLN